MSLNGIASSIGDVMAGVGVQDQNSLLHTTAESWENSRLNCVTLFYQRAQCAKEVKSLERRVFLHGKL